MAVAECMHNGKTAMTMDNTPEVTLLASEDEKRTQIPRILKFSRKPTPTFSTSEVEIVQNYIKK